MVITYLRFVWMLKENGTSIKTDGYPYYLRISKKRQTDLMSQIMKLLKSSLVIRKLN